MYYTTPSLVSISFKIKKNIFCFKIMGSQKCKFCWTYSHNLIIFPLDIRMACHLLLDYFLRFRFVCWTVVVLLAIAAFVAIISSSLQLLSLTIILSLSPKDCLPYHTKFSFEKLRKDIHMVYK